MSVALKIAVREGRSGRNPAALTDAPRKAATTLHALDLPESIQFLQHAANDKAMGARWATALLTGPRRGAVIGLERISDELRLGNEFVLTFSSRFSPFPSTNLLFLLFFFFFSFFF